MKHLVVKRILKNLTEKEGKKEIKNKRKLKKQVKKFLNSMIEQHNKKGKIKNKVLFFKIVKMKKVRGFYSLEPNKYKELTIIYVEKNIHGTIDFGKIKVPLHHLDKKEANLCSYQYKFLHQIPSFD